MNSTYMRKASNLFTGVKFSFVSCSLKAFVYLIEALGLINHECCISEFGYSVKFICNPKIKEHAHGSEKSHHMFPDEVNQIIIFTATCGPLIPLTGIRPRPSAGKGRSPSTGHPADSQRPLGTVLKCSLVWPPCAFQRKCVL